MIAALALGWLALQAVPVAPARPAGAGWALSWVAPAPADVRSIAIGDLDGDGRPGLVTLSPRNSGALLRVYHRERAVLREMFRTEVGPGDSLLCGRFLQGWASDVVVANGSLVRWRGTGPETIPLAGADFRGWLRRPSGEACLLTRDSGVFSAVRIVLDPAGKASLTPEPVGSLLKSSIAEYAAGQLTLGAEEMAATAPALAGGDALVWDTAGAGGGAWYGMSWVNGHRSAAMIPGADAEAAPILVAPTTQRVVSMACGSVGGYSWGVSVLTVSQPEGKGARIYTVCPAPASRRTSDPPSRVGR